MDELNDIKRRLDKYGDKLSEHDIMHAMHTKEIQELKDQGVRVCKLLTETKENLMTRFDSQDSLLQELLAEKYRKEGEEAANQKNQKEEKEKISLRIELFKLIPDLLKMIVFLGGLSLVAMKYMPK